MKKLDLAALGVEEMSDAQMMEVDGGSWSLYRKCCEALFTLAMEADWSGVSNMIDRAGGPAGYMPLR